MPKSTIVLFSGDLDKALAAMVIANGAAASGWDVTMFFTFWGLNILRHNKNKARKKKDFMSKMFGWMMPKGGGKAKLSKMNMGGMGTWMMKKRMKVKKVQTLNEMMDDAHELDVKFLACDMSMDVMGLQKEEFINHVNDIVGVGTYIKECKDADQTLFI